MKTFNYTQNIKFLITLRIVSTTTILSMAIKSATLLEGYILEQTAKKMKLGFAKELNKLKLDVTVDQWIVLDRLSSNDKVSQFELAESTSKDAPTITRILDLLEKKKIVHRKQDPKDRRKFLIGLSAKGKKIIEQIKPLSVSYRSKCYDGIKPGEMKILKNILNIINTNLKTN